MYYNFTINLFQFYFTLRCLRFYMIICIIKCCKIANIFKNLPLTSSDKGIAGASNAPAQWYYFITLHTHNPAKDCFIEAFCSAEFVCNMPIRAFAAVHFCSTFNRPPVQTRYV